MELFIMFLLAVIMPDSRNVTGIELEEAARRQIEYIFKILQNCIALKSIVGLGLHFYQLTLRFWI